MKRRGSFRLKRVAFSLLLLLLAAAGGYLAALPREERSCALILWDGLTVEECVLRMHE